MSKTTKQSNRPLVGNHVASKLGGQAGKVHIAARASTPLKNARKPGGTNKGSSR